MEFHAPTHRLLWLYFLFFAPLTSFSDNRSELSASLLQLQLRKTLGAGYHRYWVGATRKETECSLLKAEPTTFPITNSSDDDSGRLRKIQILLNGSRSYNLPITSSDAAARSSKVPNLFGCVSGDIILFVSKGRRRLKARNQAVILIFIPFTTHQKTSFTE